MPPERAALLDATPPSEYPPFCILSLLMMLPPQPRRFRRSQSSIAGYSRRAQRRTLSLDAPMRFDNPPRLPLAHAFPDDTPRPTRYGGNQLPWRHPAACPDLPAHALPPPQPRQEQPPTSAAAATARTATNFRRRSHGKNSHDRRGAIIYSTTQNPDAGDPTPPSQHHHYLNLPPCSMLLSWAPNPFPLSPQSSLVKPRRRSGN